MSGVEISGVSIRRGNADVVTDLDVRLAAGQWLAIVGPNGAGKTSLLHAIAGLLPFTGDITIGGHDPRRLARRRLARIVALMPQQPVIPAGMTARDLISLGRTPFLRRFATESAHDKNAVDTEIARLGLAEFADRPADALSGGELQRVMLARALCQEPRVLLLDEPTSALDVGHQQTVLDLVDQIRDERGLTVLAAMHDLTLAGQYAQRILLLDRGRAVRDGAPAHVLTADLLNQTYAARVEVLDRACGPAVIATRATG
ncbi:MAG: ABC transporter ATP-binding protein [Arachnia sp.]